jgi:hypothetical protein
MATHLYATATPPFCYGHPFFCSGHPSLVFTKLMREIFFNEHHLFFRSTTLRQAHASWEEDVSCSCKSCSHIPSGIARICVCLALSLQLTLASCSAPSSNAYARPKCNSPLQAFVFPDRSNPDNSKKGEVEGRVEGAGGKGKGAASGYN